VQGAGFRVHGAWDNGLELKVGMEILAVRFVASALSRCWHT
jgi:hypothetical protein